MTSRIRSSRASEVAKNRPPSSRMHHDAGELLVVRVLVELAEDLRARLAARARACCGRVATETSQSSDRPIPIIDAGQHAEDERADDRGDRDPEVEPLHPGQPPHLRHVHHAHDDGLDDQRRQHRLGQVGEQRRQERAASAGRSRRT